MRFLLGLGLLFSMFTSPLLADGPKVVTSIKPIHALVAGVMEGVDTPYLLIEGSASPHTYALTPSNAEALQNADIVFWIGEDLEAFLETPIETLSTNAKNVALGETVGLTILPFREGGAFEKHMHDDDHDEHAHGDHDHEEHEDSHKHDDHADHDHEAHEDSHKHDDHADHDHETHEDSHKHDEHADHDHEAHEDSHKEDDHADHDHHAHEGDHDHHGADMHLWLDPANAKIMVGAIATALSEADPANEATYLENAASVQAELDVLITETKALLADVADAPFVVFHDAYQYFEQRFGVTAIGSITVSPEIIPGAARIAEIQQRVRDTRAKCVFSEPQFEPKLVQVAIEGTSAQAGVLDPIGASLESGPDAYKELISGLANAMHQCLAGK